MNKHKSKAVTEGIEKAPMRSLFYAMGYTKEELDRPLIGIVSAHSDIVPGHFHLDKIVEAVKAGVRTPLTVLSSYPTATKSCRAWSWAPCG